MSAIFGILDLEGRAIEPAWVKSMQEDLAHRGPDGQRLYMEDSLVLGHMLLQVTPESIYDQSPYEENGLVITANARLDEREALMDRLGIAPEDRDRITDPLLLLRSYIKFGKDFIKDIYGDFAFAIWDKVKKELFCARDQIGVKPFLYCFQDGRFVFSTELKSIVRVPCVKTEIDYITLRDKAIAVWDELEKTHWKQIFRLKPAHTLFLRNKTIITSKYWRAKYQRNKKFKTEDETAKELKILLEKVIADRMRVTGDVGAPLSGGLDSSSIACVAAKQLGVRGKDLVTASSVFSPDYNQATRPDETEFINAVLRQELNIQPSYVYNTDLSIVKGLNNKFDLHYAPVNGFYYVDEALYQQFSRKKIRRVLSGLLGDFTTSNNVVKPLPVLLLNGRFLALKKNSLLIYKNSNQSFLKFIKQHILIAILPLSLRWHWQKIKGKSLYPWSIDHHPLKLQLGEKSKLQKRVIKTFSGSDVNVTRVEKNIWPEAQDFFKEDWDCGSSHYQVEMTYPLCDRRIIEFLLKIPVEHFFAGGVKRGLIKKSLRDVLPQEIRERKTKGLYSPGYVQLLFKEMQQLIKLMPDDSDNDRLAQFVNLKKLKAGLTNLSKSNNDGIFTYQTWTLFVLALGACFDEWNFKKNK